MDTLIDILKEYDLCSILIFLLLLICAFIGIYTTGKKLISILEEYRYRKNAVENHNKDTNDRIEKLEEQGENQQKQIDGLSQSIEEIHETIKQVQENQNRSNRATCRSAMYRLANELINKTWMSQTEYDTLNDITDVFLISGGEKYVRPAIVQRALSLPVLTDEEIERMKAQSNKKSTENTEVEQ